MRRHQSVKLRYTVLLYTILLSKIGNTCDALCNENTLDFGTLFLDKPSINTNSLVYKTNKNN